MATAIAQMPYQIILSRIAETHLQALTAREQSVVIDAIAHQLTYQPTSETKNRKPMRPNP